LDASGQHLWSKRFGDATLQAGVSAALDGIGNALVTGYFNGAVDFGGGPLASAGGGDFFVAKLDPAGQPLWSKRYGDASYQYWIGRVAADSFGNVLLTGSFEGSVDFGGLPLQNAGGCDLFVVKLTP
jgi:hypothetical protein